jgi:hypothetical protein
VVALVEVPYLVDEREDLTGLIKLGNPGDFTIC